MPSGSGTSSSGRRTFCTSHLTGQSAKFSSALAETASRAASRSSTASELSRAGGVSLRGVPAAASARSSSAAVGASAGPQVTSDSERVDSAAPGASRSRTSSTKKDCDCGLPSSSLERDDSTSSRSAREQQR